MLVLTAGLVALAVVARAVSAEARRLQGDVAPMRQLADAFEAASADVTAIGNGIARLRGRARLRRGRH
jgi:hypothetical protein